MVSTPTDVNVHLDGLDPLVQMRMNAPPTRARMVGPVWMETALTHAAAGTCSEDQNVNLVSIILIPKDFSGEALIHEEDTHFTRTCKSSTTDGL